MADDPSKTLKQPAPIPRAAADERPPPAAASAAPPAPPFLEADDDWDVELEKWDAALPIDPKATPGQRLALPVPTGLPMGQVNVGGAEGAVPDDENPFFETPTTVVSEASPLLDAGAADGAAEDAITDATEGRRGHDGAAEGPAEGELVSIDAVPEGAFDDGAASASGSYAAMVTIDDSHATVFDRDPPDEEPSPFPLLTLPEMAAEPWRAGTASFFAAGDTPPIAPPTPETWQALAALVADERTAAPDGARAVDLHLASARLALLLDQTEEARDELRAALAVESAAAESGEPVAGAAVVAHRARLTLGERARGSEDDETKQALARLSSLAHADQAYYRCVLAEQTLDQAPLAAGDPAVVARVAAIPKGLGRTLAEAELGAGVPAVVASLLDKAGRGLGGALGAAFLSLAAAFSEAARDFQNAAEQRCAALRFDAACASVVPGLVRDAARFDPEPAQAAVDDLLVRVPASAMKVALARWGASLARLTGDGARAAHVLAAPDLGPLSPTLARDRVDAAGAAGADASELWRLLSEASELWPGPVARACLVLRAVEVAHSEDELGRAVAAAELIVGEHPDMPVLAPGVEALAFAARERGLPAVEQRALRLWRRIDPARWVPASYALAAALDRQAPARAARSDTGDAARASDDAATSAEAAVLEEIAAAEPQSAVAWGLAARDARAGRDAAAIIRLRGLAGAWAAGPLGVAMAELALERESHLASPATCDRLQQRLAAGAGGPELRLTLRRALRRLRDPGRWAALAAVEAGGTDDGAARAALLLEPHLCGPGPVGVAAPRDVAAWGEVLELVPLHPAALALAFASGAQAAELVDRYVAGARGVARRRATLAAATWAAVAGDARHALAIVMAAPAVRAAEKPIADGAAVGSAGADDDLADVATRLVGAVGELEEKNRILVELASRAGARAERLVAAAEAEEENGHRSAAGYLFRRARGAPDAALVEADVTLGLRRLAPRGAEAAWGTADGAGTRAGTPTPAFDARPASLARAVREARWADVVAQLIDAPPHENAAGVATLVLAAQIDEGRADGARAVPVLARARAAAEEGPEDERDLGAAMRTADGREVDATELAAALDALSVGAHAGNDDRSAALFLLASARARPEADAAAGGGGDGPVEERLRAAVMCNPTSVAATLAWRRWLARAGRGDEAADAAGAEAEALVDPVLRVQALVRAAALTTFQSGPKSHPENAGAVMRAAGFLRRALAIAPHDHVVFTKLRDLYDEGGRHADLADLLSMRMGATTNPFEVTALHLARSELFAGPLGDRAAAKRELDAILQKEPQHARALGFMADLEELDGNDVAAVDLLVRRAAGERSPEKLRELFLRLGRIHTQRVPDPKRAVTAYARVLQLDADNREALDALSELYFALGETKNAVAITERLTRIETAPARRAAYHIRLGHLAERAGDARAAAPHFRRAVEEAPHDLEALGELVRFLDKTRDVAGRRALLDRAAEDLRRVVIATPSDATARAAFVAVSRWRGRTVTAAVAAELGTLLAAVGSDEARLPDWAEEMVGPRSVAALAKPELDDRLYPSVVSPALRQLFRVLGPLLAEGGRADLARYRLDRAQRVPAGRAPRDSFEAVAADLALGTSFEVYVVPQAAGAAATALMVVPGKPPAAVIGATVVKLGTPAVRFAAARALRSIATHLDAPMADSEEELAAWLVGVIRQFVGDYRHPSISPDVAAARTARVAKLIPRKLRAELMPFAMESAGELDVAELALGIKESVNRVGLLACGSLAAALRVILTVGRKTVTPETLNTDREARAMVAFALSDDYDELARELG